MSDKGIVVKETGYIEEEYQNFHNQVLCKYQKQMVDFFGINVSENKRNDIFKLYLKGIFSESIDYPFITYLKKKDMIRYVTEVKDNQINEMARIDIGIKNRTDKNMEDLFEWLRLNYSAFRQNENEIISKSKMKIIPLKGYTYASMYFIGASSFQNDNEILKFHYYTGYISNPDNLLSDLQFEDDYYLDYIKQIGTNELNRLTDMAAILLSKGCGNMWVIGIDYTIAGAKKYKIYLRNVNDCVYDYLNNILTQYAFSKLAEKVMEIMDWNKEHVEYIIKGIAICMDKNQMVSINFYFELQ